VTFYAVLWAAASSDLIATHFGMSIEGVITTLQVLFFAAPIAAYIITKRTCLALQRKDREIALHGYESGRIVRLPGGEYIEVHEQLSDYERWKLLDYNEYQPLTVRPTIKEKSPWERDCVPACPGGSLKTVSSLSMLANWNRSDTRPQQVRVRAVPKGGALTR